MGFGGSVLSMIISLRNNERLRKRREPFGKRENTPKYKREYEFKKVSQKELDRINKKFYIKIQKENRISLIKTITFFSLTLALAIFAGYNIYNNNITKRERINREKKELSQQKYRENQEAIQILLNKGYMLLNKENYFSAKQTFYKAFKIDQNDERVQIAICTAYVYDCMINDKACKATKQWIKRYKHFFGDTQKILDLEYLLKPKH